MTDPMDDPRMVWGELYAPILRSAGRLENRFGTCPSCDLGASDAANVGGIVWSYCISCMTRWPVLDTPLARLDPQSDAFNELFVEALSMCIDLDPLPVEIPPPEIPISDTSREETFRMRRENTTAPASFGIDPRRFQGPKDGKVFSSLTDDQVIRVTDVVLRDLREYPLTKRHPMSGCVMIDNHHAMWTRIRDVVIDEKGTTVGRVLQRPEIPAPVFALRDAISLLVDLREKRAELAARLADLDVIESAFTSAPAEAAVAS